MSKNESARPTGTPKAACCGGSGHGGHDHAGHDHHAHTAATVRDPVCGMTVNPATSKHRFDYRLLKPNTTVVSNDGDAIQRVREAFDEQGRPVDVLGQGIRCGT